MSSYDVSPCRVVLYGAKSLALCFGSIFGSTHALWVLYVKFLPKDQNAKKFTVNCSPKYCN
jgi:hypothetical protein